MSNRCQLMDKRSLNLIQSHLLIKPYSLIFHYYLISTAATTNSVCQLHTGLGELFYTVDIKSASSASFCAFRLSYYSYWFTNPKQFLLLCSSFGCLQPGAEQAVGAGHFTLHQLFCSLNMSQKHQSCIQSVHFKQVLLSAEENVMENSGVFCSYFWVYFFSS